MTVWWESLDTLGKVYACIAFPSTLILVIQIILSIVGFDGDGADIADGDVSDFAFDDGLSIFTVRGVIAFLAVGAWTGLSVSDTISPWLRVGISLAAGFAAMLAVALLFKLIMRLQDDGTLDVKNAVGLVGTVYLTVPAKRQGAGKVNVLVQERYAEIEAVSDDGESLSYGTPVQVVGVLGERTLIVTKK